MNGWGGMPGGQGGGMGGGMPNIPPGMMNDPEFMQIMSDPATQELMPLLMQAQSNPGILQQHMNNPQLQRIMQVFQRHMGGGQGNQGQQGALGGWGMPSGGNSPAQPSASRQKSSDYVSIMSQIELERYLKAPNVLTLVYFSMQGCGPCRAIGPAFDALARKYKGKANFCKVMVNEARQVCQYYGVNSFPTFLFLYNQETVHRVGGGRCAMELNQKTQEYINNAPITSNVSNVAASGGGYVHFPVKESNIANFPKAKLKSIKKKLIECNNVYASDPTSSKFCNEGELLMLEEMCSKLTQSDPVFTEQEYNVVEKVLLNWDDQDVTSAIHLFSILILKPNAATFYGNRLRANGGEDPLFNQIFEFCASDRIFNQMLAGRTIVNALSNPGVISGFDDFTSLLDAASELRKVTAGKPAVKIRTSFSLICTRIAFYLYNHQDNDDENTKPQILSNLVEVLAEEEVESILYISLQCLGTLCLNDPECVTFAEMYEMQQLLITVSERVTDKKVAPAIKKACEEIIQVLAETGDAPEEVPMTQAEEEEDSLGDIYN